MILLEWDKSECGGEVYLIPIMIPTPTHSTEYNKSQNDCYVFLLNKYHIRVKFINVLAPV